MEWFFGYIKHIETKYTHHTQPVSRIFTVISRFNKGSSVIGKTTSFKRHSLSAQEMSSGCKAGLDTWADTCCVGKHVHVREVLEGKLANASGFSPSLPTLTDIPIVNCTFAYDDSFGNTYLIEVNNALYMGDQMEHVLLCPNQCETNGVKIDLRPSHFYPMSDTASTIIFPSGLTIPIEHDGPLPYFHVRHPTDEELLLCPTLEMTSYDDWNPYNLGVDLSATVSEVKSSLPNVG